MFNPSNGADGVGGWAVVSNALLQGSISEATGGKFANGAMSGAFRTAFNDALNPDEVEESRASRKDLVGRVSITTSVDGDVHEYRIRGLICSVSTTGCNESYANEVFNYVNRNDIPFTDDDLQTGKHILRAAPFLSGDPIQHDYDITSRTSVNTTITGHRFHPGTVTHQVHFEGGKLYYELVGSGSGSMPSFNNFVGLFLFRPGVETVVDRYRLRQ